MKASECLAENLKRLQAAANRTNVEFADELGISTSTLYKLKRGEDGFSSETLDQISTMLNVSPADLLGDASARWMCETLLQTVAVLSELAGEKRESALYHLGELVALVG